MRLNFKTQDANHQSILRPANIFIFFHVRGACHLIPSQDTPSKHFGAHIAECGLENPTKLLATYHLRNAVDKKTIKMNKK
jgi:hypothetical protein